MTPHPSNFRSLTAYRAAQAAHLAKQPKQARRTLGDRPFTFLFILGSQWLFTLLVALNALPQYWPAWALIWGGLLFMLLLKVWRDCRSDTQAYREEHDL